jgi:hypothetical protein
MNPPSRQLPNHILHELFGEVNVIDRGDDKEITATILLEPLKEGSQTGVALDGSASMKTWFGRHSRFRDDYDTSLNDKMVGEGKAKYLYEDGVKVIEFLQDGLAELQQSGWIINDPNIVEPIAREVIPHLASRIDADGGTTVIYWACGDAGNEIEMLGDLTAEEAAATSYKGPENWGEGTCLLPALRYFIERFADAEWGFYVFVTDGNLDDLEEVKAYTADLAHRIHAGKAKPVKCVLIGVGTSIDASKLAELDDLPDQLGLDVDIWDHKIAGTMRDLRDIFAEVVDEGSVIASSARVFDGAGNVAKVWSDGVPARLVFTLPRDSTLFTLEIEGHRIQQPLM